LLRTNFHFSKDRVVKILLAIGVLIVSLGGCAIVPVDYGYRGERNYNRGDGYSHGDYRGYQRGDGNYYRGNGYQEHGQ